MDGLDFSNLVESLAETHSPSRRMTTPTSNLIDLFEVDKKSIPSRVCLCGRRPILVTKDDKLVRWYQCGKCMTTEDMKKMSDDGYVMPDLHPLMPRVFHGTDVNRLHPKMQDATRWMPTMEKSGMLLHGTSGIGKTRAAWYWVQQCWKGGLTNAYNLNFRFLSMMELEERLTASFADYKHSAMLKELCNVPLLIIDDLGKERMTSRMATDIFAIVDQRSMNMSPTIITTNFNSQGLIDRFQPQDKETAIAMVRRLKDYYAIYGMQ